ncbi:Ig-like domain-containing protein [Tenacibaculum soleae]|uniref:Ig-like domain-containing protein n=1 Tax=Tenacibaculum soleae TaxID=447689 RepID=UPI0026E25830|nr:Ig-like domain-containing protein [Tenacibaculum soleae]MDO6743421.1 Ig-like domain-containing protein [Tenacibaculum soleae]
MKNKVLFLVVLVSIVIISCARRGRPDGGPKDEDAPIMVTANPPYESIHFNKKEIKIEFDEYIVLKNISKQLVISPPLKYPPIITPQGTPSKYINIEILDTLKTNTTYTFNFGNAVQDNNEKNTLESFKYVFSTGNYIDSLKIKGSVTTAFTKEKLKNISVLLYRLDSSYTDSVIYKQKPNYVTNTLDSTNFEFTNLKDGKYLLLGLKEASSDYLFNSKTDEIGFYTDTISLPKDTLIIKPIRIFKEKQSFKFKRGKEIVKGKIQFGYEGERGNMNIKLLSKVPDTFKSFFQYEKDKDTLNYWHTPLKRDSLNFIVTNKDFIDTIKVRLRKKKIDSLAISSNINSTLHLNDTLFLDSNNPIVTIDTSKFSIVDKDTVNVNFEVKKQAINKLAILFEKTPKNTYKFNVLPKGIIDLYETSNDSLNYNFKTLTTEDYGSIILDLNKETNHPVIIQLLHKDKVLKTRYISSSEKIEFNLLEPKEYTVRAIIDENNNHVWDTGNFLLKKQPEQVIYFDKVFKLRANWIQNETFVIK